MPSVAEIAWRQRTFAVQTLPNGSGMPRGLHMGDISRDGDEVWCFREPASARPCTPASPGCAPEPCGGVSAVRSIPSATQSDAEALHARAVEPSIAAPEADATSNQRVDASHCPAYLPRLEQSSSIQALFSRHVSRRRALQRAALSVTASGHHREQVVRSSVGGTVGT